MRAAISGWRFGIDAPAQPEQVDVVVEIDEPQHVENARLERRRVGDAGLLVIDPVGGDVEFAVRRLPRLFEQAGALRAFAAASRRPDSRGRWRRPISRLSRTLADNR